MSERGIAFRRAVAATAQATDARALWRGLGRAGVLARLHDAGDEPAGLDRELLGILIAELDAHQPLGAVLAVCVQVASAVPLLRTAADGSPLARAVLAQAIRGESVVALAATDAAVAGSALMDMGTWVDLDGDVATLSGGKDWISNAAACDFALVLARHRPARHFTSFCWVLVPAGHPGVSCEPATSRHFAGAAVGHLRFADVRLDRGHVVGRPGLALADFARHIGTERLAGALWARALCRRALADTYGYLSGRSTGERTLWDNAAVRERFARCLVEWSRLDAMCAAHTSAAPTMTAGMLLKAAYAESVDRILDECVNLRGADAFRDGGLAEIRAQAAMFGIAGGATGAMLAGVAEYVDDVLRTGE